MITKNVWQQLRRQTKPATVEPVPLQQTRTRSTSTDCANPSAFFCISKLIRGTNCHRWLDGASEQHKRTFSISMCQSTLRGHKEITSMESWKEQPSNGEDCEAGTHRQGWPHQRCVYDALGIKGVTGMTSRSFVCHYLHGSQPVITKILNLEPSNFASPLPVPP